MSDYDKIMNILTRNAEQLEQLRLSQAKTDIQLEQLRLSQAKTDAQLAETSAQLKLSQAKTDKQVNKMSKKIDSLADQFGGFVNNDGIITEHKVCRAIDAQIQEQGHISICDIVYDEWSADMKKHTRTAQAQYDIVLINTNHLLVIEVKKKFHTNDIEKYNKNLAKLPILFPYYKDYTIQAAIFSDYYYPELIEQARAANMLMIQEKAGQIELI